MIVNYIRKTFIVQATGVNLINIMSKHNDSFLKLNRFIIAQTRILKVEHQWPVL